MATNNTQIRPQIPIFNGKNYEFWAIKMKTLFCSQDIWDLVEKSFAEPQDDAAYQRLQQTEKDQLKDNRKKDVKALFLIQQAMDESIFPKVSAATRSKKAWETLETAYQGFIGKRKRKIKSRGRGRGKCGRMNTDQGKRTNQSNRSFNNRGRGRNQFQEQSSRFDKSNIQCYYCKKYDRFAYECRKKQVEFEKLGANYSDVSNNNSGSLFVACNMAQESSKDVWF
ncbi:uncharacterized protein LOC131859893 [Cryptomeria japonica]|uniref:uncharacterized protein LOC131859893 n=1 Tax=Cryptomeria japonica TaxID=3369 RepID=UPI0027DAACAC|nr:uncharacterized protein LOC131859893 [Cryptomeria japonica]